MMMILIILIITIRRGAERDPHLRAHAAAGQHRQELRLQPLGHRDRDRDLINIIMITIKQMLIIEMVIVVIIIHIITYSNNNTYNITNDIKRSSRPRASRRRCWTTGRRKERRSHERRYIWIMIPFHIFYLSISHVLYAGSCGLVTSASRQRAVEMKQPMNDERACEQATLFYLYVEISNRNIFANSLAFQG